MKLIIISKKAKSLLVGHIGNNYKRIHAAYERYVDNGKVGNYYVALRSLEPIVEEQVSINEYGHETFIVILYLFW